MLRRAALLTLLLTMPSCILKDDRCGPGQVEQDEELEGCTCAPNLVPAPNGESCVACTNPNEESKGATCGCINGYSKQGGVCMPTVVSDAGTTTTATGQGETCSTNAECASFDAKFCLALPKPPGMCLVSGCASGSVKCSTGRVCCDLSPYGVPALMQAGGLCLPAGSCNAPAVEVP